jgi:hypothetical protein
VTLNGQTGVLVHQDWLVSDKVTSIGPGATLLWPTVVAGNGGAQILAPTTSEPLAPHVKVRLFPTPVPAAGLPARAPDTIDVVNAGQRKESEVPSLLVSEAELVVVAAPGQSLPSQEQCPFGKSLAITTATGTQRNTPTVPPPGDVLTKAHLTGAHTGVL